MNTSQIGQLQALLNQRTEVRNFETDFDIATLIDLKINEGGNFFIGVTLTTAYRNAINTMIDDRKAVISAGITALGVTEND